MDQALNAITNPCTFSMLNSFNHARVQITNPFGKCKICKDKATGFHYGVESCEGCKAFFKRSMLREEKYVCYFGHQCELKPDTRSRCKACRLRRCIQAGMTLKAVKMGRVTKDLRNFALENNSTSSNKSSYVSTNSVVTSDRMDGNEIVSRTSKDNQLICKESIESSISILNRDYTLEILANFIQNSFKNDMYYVKHLVNEACDRINRSYATINTGEDIPNDKIKSIFFENVKIEIKFFTKLLRSIPVFNKLEYTDFFCIVQQKLFDYTVTKYHKLFINNENYFTFKNGLQNTRKRIIEVTGNELAYGIFNIFNALNCLNLNEKEECVLIMYTISNPKYLNLKNNIELTKFHELISRTLANEFFLSKRSKEFVQNFYSLINYIEKMRYFELNMIRNKVLVID